MKRKSVKMIRDEVVQVSKHGGYAWMRMFVNEIGTRWEEIELSIDPPLRLSEEPKDRVWP